MDPQGQDSSLACASCPIVSPGAPVPSLLNCILLHYYADILIMQICFLDSFKYVYYLLIRP